MSKQYDIILCGLGPVGNILLSALADTALKIATVDLNPAYVKKNDNRKIGISLGTQMVLEKIKRWDALKQFAIPILHIHTSEQNAFFRVRAAAKDYHLPAFGYIIPFDYLANVSEHYKNTNLDFYLENSVASVKHAAQTSTVTLQDGQQLTAKLIIVAEGVNSKTRTLLDIATQSYDYQQCAFVANLEHSRSNQNIAFERFTEYGPFAILPERSLQSGVFCALPYDAELDIKFLQKMFGYRLGRFSNLSNVQKFPLKLVYAPNIISTHSLVLGNAANNIHPVASQGFNLGVRDAYLCAEHIKKNIVSLGSDSFLQKYAALRSSDHNRLRNFTHNLVQSFSLDNIFLRSIRNCAFPVINQMPWLKKNLIYNNLGIINEV